MHTTGSIPRCPPVAGLGQSKVRPAKAEQPAQTSALWGAGAAEQGSLAVPQCQPICLSFNVLDFIAIKKDCDINSLNRLLSKPYKN